MAKRSTKKLFGWFLANLACVATLSCSAGMPAASPADLASYRTRCVPAANLTVAPDADQAADEAQAAETAKAETPTKLRRLRQREVSRAHGVKAREILDSTRDKAFGAVIPFEIEGERFAAVIERHYHEPGGEARPWGWHRGISLFKVVPVS